MDRAFRKPGLDGDPAVVHPASMLIFKILRTAEWEALQAAGSSAGAPVDVADGFVHFSAPHQLELTAAKHFSGEDGLWLLAVGEAGLGDALHWEVSRGGDRFPHLYRELRLEDVIWARPLPLGPDGHVFPLGVLA